MKPGASAEVLQKMIDGRIQAHNQKRALRNSKWITDKDGIVHIPLRNGHEALIDSADETEARNYSWLLFVAKRSRTLYAKAHMPGVKPRKELFLHNLVFKSDEGKTVDHRDKNGLNCVRSNLRQSSQSQNAMNRHRRLGKNPCTGVYQTSAGRWDARISINKKQKSIGIFSSLEDAISARKRAAIEHYGEFSV